MAADEKKSVSLKIDETIESVLGFLGRYFKTLGRLTIRPYDPQPLLAAAATSPPVFVPPLTFLTIGAFLFALLIDVYPRGFAGLVDFIWMTEEIRGNVRERWKDAFTPTTLITAGLPTVIAITSIAALAGRLLLREAADRTAWFNAACYAFGYQTAAIFLIISLESLHAGLEIAFPFLSAIRLGDQGASAIALTILAIAVAAALFVPLVLLSATLIALGNQRRLRRIAMLSAAFVFWAAAQYFYAAVASVLPELSARYFPKARPRIMIFEEIAAARDRRAAAFTFQLLVENKTDEDVLVELDPHRIDLRLARRPDDPRPLERWHATEWSLAGRRDEEDPRRFISLKGSRSIWPMRAGLFDLSAACKAYAAARKRDEETPGFKDSLVQLFLSAEPSFRSRTDSARTDRSVDVDRFCR
jgi:hypothetical protein